MERQVRYYIAAERFSRFSLSPVVMETLFSTKKVKIYMEVNIFCALLSCMDSNYFQPFPPPGLIAAERPLPPGEKCDGAVRDISGIRSADIFCPISHRLRKGRGSLSEHPFFFRPPPPAIVHPPTAASYES